MFFNKEGGVDNVTRKILSILTILALVLTIMVAAVPAGPVMAFRSPPAANAALPDGAVSTPGSVWAWGTKGATGKAMLPGLGEGLASGVVLAGHRQCPDQTQPILGLFRVAVQRGPEQRHRRPRLPAFCGDDTQIVVGVRLPGIGLQNGSVEGFCLRQTPCLVMGDGLVQDIDIARDNRGRHGHALAVSLFLLLRYMRSRNSRGRQPER